MKGIPEMMAPQKSVESWNPKTSTSGMSSEILSRPHDHKRYQSGSSTAATMSGFAGLPSAGMAMPVRRNMTPVMRKMMTRSR